MRVQRPTLDANGDLLGPFADLGQRSAEILNLRGQESVMAQRLQGSQPVIIGLRTDAVTRAIDNTWRLVNARSRQIYDITAATITDDQAWVEILATAKIGDLDA